MAGDGWEAGATGLPLAKKSVEWTLFARVGWVNHVRLVRLETSSADMLQRLLVIVLVLVRLLFRTVPLVESNTNTVFFHERLGDTLHMTTGRRILRRTTTFSAGTVRLWRTRRGDVLLERVLLRCDNHVRLNVIHATFDELPVVRKLKFLHLPGLVYQTVSFENVGMLVVETHVYKTLQERELIRQFKVEPVNGNF